MSRECSALIISQTNEIHSHKIRTSMEMKVLDLQVHDTYLIHLQNTNQNKMSKCNTVICMYSGRYNSTMLNWYQHLTIN
jgi:hypothetical protein